jgi:hypothetical protein
MTPIELPPLPVKHVVVDGLWEEVRGPYDEDDMRAYGERCAREERERCSAEIAKLTRERDDYRERFEKSHMAQMNQISGGRYPDGGPAW